MDIFSILIILVGLCLFEIISSVDNAVINADVLHTMKPKGRKWFLLWGILFAVFVVRGLLPWIIVFATNPALGIIGSFTATFSSDPRVISSMEASTPILLVGGGTFLIFIFFYWLFTEPKNYGLRVEKFFDNKGIWFYSIVSAVLALIVWYSLHKNPLMAFSAVIGSTAFFITNGLKENAKKAEENLMKEHMSDISKIIYLEVIDATFSIDGVLGAFAFTLSIPLILLGNGLGAFVVRELTVRNIDKVKKYPYLKNGAMYSIFFLGLIMILDSFGVEIPIYVSPLVTFGVIGFFFWRSHIDLKKMEEIVKKDKHMEE
ncbi:Uncharacterised protein [uncultured archaeon]|nr:Uncharacterised protein [uncultured archaeon]